MDDKFQGWAKQIVVEKALPSPTLLESKDSKPICSWREVLNGHYGQGNAGRFSRPSQWLVTKRAAYFVTARLVSRQFKENFCVCRTQQITLPLGLTKSSPESDKPYTSSTLRSLTSRPSICAFWLNVDTPSCTSPSWSDIPKIRQHVLMGDKFLLNNIVVEKGAWW